MTNNGRGFARISFGQFADPVHGLGVDLALNLGDVDHLRGGVGAGNQILAAEVVPALTGNAALPALTDGSADGTPGHALIPTGGAAALIDVAQVQGQVHAQAVHRVGELAERNPNETASIVRQWLSEDEAQPA